jgi:hypothetical protein
VSLRELFPLVRLELQCTSTVFIELIEYVNTLPCAILLSNIITTRLKHVHIYTHNRHIFNALCANHYYFMAFMFTYFRYDLICVVFWVVMQ